MLASAGHRRPRWEAECFVVLQDVLFGFLAALLGQERGMAVDAFEQNDTDAPLVATGIVFCPFNHFRCHVLTSSHNTPGRLADPAAVAPIQERLAVVHVFPLMLLEAGGDTTGPLLPGFGVLILVSVLFLVLFVAVDCNLQLFHQALPVTTIVGRIVGPVPIKRQSKITDLEMARCRHQKVVRFDIAVYALE